MNKIISAEEAKKFFKDGSTVMVGGFMTNGTPMILIDAIAEKGVKDLTIICNDAGVPNSGTGKLLTNKQIKKLIASHVGLNPDVAKALIAGELDLQLVPQGTLAERIRAAGAGLGGFLTPTGIGTDIETGKTKMAIDGKDYLLELPLKADVAVIRGSIVDKLGNVYYKGTTNNFNSMMATAAEVVIVAAEKIVEVGELPAEYIMTPAIYVDYIVGGEK
ncbi:MAG: CoA transferase subunit A [Clostridiales bacterium]|nr:CoA transferase subunit A [Clostridiales bacterium]